MMSLKSLFKFLLLLACIVAVSFAKKKDEDAEAALRDLHMGMAGLKEASNNPAVLAQLMRDLQVSGPSAAAFIPSNEIFSLSPLICPVTACVNTRIRK